eukprot:CAMPEP_0116095094 /NCGR_PEP_ID=MMETSP0327-20121206/9480_1 /TAXON_ID=44447 /ORGANISM="Pseudo-nitzschia delicatissima, Strain B596" /LENGTH=304 /DNA_ID=CAMNT_0003586739 /DNA_START=110 /DNA_END=1024 /DNA_ORIENTATION=-
MSVISKKNFVGALLVLLVTLLSSVNGAIVITETEKVCLEQTGKLFQDGGVDLLTAKNEFQMAIDMEMTSSQKMYAKYPADRLRTYETYCAKYGGKMHIIYIDFFDCLLKGSENDVELTLKNFANCMADVPECEGFNQEHILEEAWDELGLHCILEDEETKKDPVVPDNDVNDDIAKKEKEAAAEGEDDVEKKEANSEYVPKEEQGKNGNRKKKGGFMKFVLFVSLCGVGYFVYDRHRKGLPIELPYALTSRLPFGRSAPSRFARRAQPGFVSDYHMISGEEENTLHFSTNLPEQNGLQFSTNLP